MIRGIQKQMIWVQTAQSRYFEGAYFVMRGQVCREEPKENEMLREANRILEEQSLQRRERSCRWSSSARRLPAFWLGMLLGSGLCALLWLIVMLWI